MKRNKLYILLTLIITVILFGTAAICTQCGANIDKALGDLGGSVDEESPGTEPGGEQPSDAEPPGEVSPEEPLSEEGNHPPVIDKIKIFEADIRIAEAEGWLSEIPMGMEFFFTIEASDEDEDDLEYFAYDDAGNNYEVRKIDNDLANLRWTSPELEGSVVLTIEILDGRGGVDNYPINMDIIGEPAEREEPVDFGEAVNSPPEIHGNIIIENLPGSDSPEGGPYNCGIHYRISVDATDPDRDPLTYRWQVDSGRIIDENANPSSWETPDNPLSCIIRVFVSDGINEEVTTAIAVEVE